VFKKVVVGIDFTDKTERAVSTAIRLAKGAQGSVVLVHVVPASVDAQKATTGSEDNVMQTIESRLRDEAARHSREHGVSVDYGVTEGSPAEELVKYVKTWGGDVIVVASEARSGLGHFLLGSVAEKLIAQSPVPVLVSGPHSH
jgi:nucleotide-binding universal stress UspA family protein